MHGDRRTQKGPGGTARLAVRAARGRQVEVARPTQSSVGSLERCAGTHKVRHGARLGAAGRLALTWAWVTLAGSGLPAGSPVLLLALPLAFALFALSHLAEDELCENPTGGR